MEPVVATDGNQWQMQRRRNRRKQAKTVAAGCNQLPFRAHGKSEVSDLLAKEGVTRLAPQREVMSQATGLRQTR